MKHNFALIFLIAFGHNVFAATLNIFYSNDNTPGFELRDIAGIPLTPGLPLVSQDGAVLQVGYFTLATTENPFAGGWVTMVGPSIRSPQFATIGDKTNDAAGLFHRDAGFATTPLGPYVFPVVGTPMSIRFFNAPASQTSTHFNTVSSVDWIWLGQGDPQTLLNMDLTTVPLLWEGGPSSAFRTTIPVPEASFAMLFLGTCLSLLFRRKRTG